MDGRWFHAAACLRSKHVGKKCTGRTFFTVPAGVFCTLLASIPSLCKSLRKFFSKAPFCKHTNIRGIYCVASLKVYIRGSSAESTLLKIGLWGGWLPSLLCEIFPKFRTVYFRSGIKPFRKPFEIDCPEVYIRVHFWTRVFAVQKRRYCTEPRTSSPKNEHPCSFLGYKFAGANSYVFCQAEKRNFFSLLDRSRPC